MSEKLVLERVTVTYKPPSLAHRILSAMLPNPIEHDYNFEYATPKGGEGALWYYAPSKEGKPYKGFIKDLTGGKK